MRDPEIDFQPAPSIRERIRKAETTAAVKEELEFATNARFMSDSTRRRIQKEGAWKLKNLKK